MKDLAPHIKRQRCLIEGFYNRDIAEHDVREYFKKICKDLSLRAYGEPVIHSPQGLGQEENQGFDAFLPLIDSGISLYVWSSASFFSVIIYTCKDFDVPTAIRGTQAFFKADGVEHLSF